MDTNAKINSKSQNASVFSESSSDVQFPQSEAEETPAFKVDYSGMMERIKKISMPVSFDSLKDFYGLV